MIGILGQLKWESLKKRRKDNRLILLYKGLKGKASVPTDDLIPKTRRCRNQHSMAFQTPTASTDVYKGSFFPQITRDWNALPDSLISSAEDAEDCVLSSLLWWELGTNSLITGPGEWLSFRRFTSKLYWSWSWCTPARTHVCSYSRAHTHSYTYIQKKRTRIRTDGWTDGRSDGGPDGRTDYRQTDRHVDRHIHRSYFLLLSSYFLYLIS